MDDGTHGGKVLAVDVVVVPRNVRSLQYPCRSESPPVRCCGGVDEDGDNEDVVVAAVYIFVALLPRRTLRNKRHFSVWTISNWGVNVERVGANVDVVVVSRWALMDDTCTVYGS